jgi:endoglucanase
MARRWLGVGGCLALLVWTGVRDVTAQDQPAPPRSGDVVFATGFEQAAERDVWSRADFAQWVPVAGRGTCLRVTAPGGQEAAAHMIRLPLDLARYRGCKLYFQCLAKAENVTKPRDTWNGAKFMFHYQSPSDGPFWQNQGDVYGTFDWKPLSFSTMLAPDATTAELDLGLQDSTGTVWFDDLKVTVYQPPTPPRPGPLRNAGPAFTGHPGLPRLRGVMSPNEFRDEDLRVLGQDWKANVIRWQMTRNWGQAGTDRRLTEYDRWLSGKLDELDQALVACRRYGIRVVVDMHSPPGGRYEDGELAIFHEPLYQRHWLGLWKRIARRYRGNPTVWGYDLINEPVQHRPSPEGVGDYLEGQVMVAKAIRAIDPKAPIFIESNEADSAWGFRELAPVDVPNLIYQVHMYTPGEFTHQGVYDKTRVFTYPGQINGAGWDREKLRASLQPVRDFQLAYNAHIYVGEFSAARWAPGAANYLRDCIAIFEEYGWDWTYHAYREWDGWSVEHGPNPDDHQPTREPTDRKRLLLEWFATNAKPAP